jgi:hypothetical protein
MYRRFGGTHCLHLQGGKISEGSNKHKTGWIQVTFFCGLYVWAQKAFHLLPDIRRRNRRTGDRERSETCAPTEAKTRISGSVSLSTEPYSTSCSGCRDRATGRGRVTMPFQLQWLYNGDCYGMLIMSGKPRRISMDAWRNWLITTVKILLRKSGSRISSRIFP